MPQFDKSAGRRDLRYLKCRTTGQNNRDVNGKCQQCGFPPLEDGACIFTKSRPRCPSCLSASVYRVNKERNSADWRCGRCGFDNDFYANNLTHLTANCRRDRANYFGSPQHLIDREREAERFREQKKSEFIRKLETEGYDVSTPSAIEQATKEQADRRKTGRPTPAEELTRQGEQDKRWANGSCVVMVIVAVVIAVAAASSC